jgi:hypothetical protein
MSDPYGTFSSVLDSPASSGFAVTPDDDSDLTISTRGLYVGGSGVLKVDLVGGSTLTFADVTAGDFLPLRVKKIYSTGTTATDLIGLY